VVFLVLVSGCSSTKPEATNTSPPGEIAELNIVTVPVALNLDNVPGPESISVKIFAGDTKHPKPIPIKGGQLEILMFNGTFFGLTNVPTPIKIWSFNSGELPLHQFSSGIGIGYEFVLQWGANRPAGRLVSVAARYTSPRQEIVTSRPSSVTVIDR